jgi:hypothetical protein
MVTVLINNIVRMNRLEKQEILEAFSSLATQVDQRFSARAEDLAALRSEVREGFSTVDKRLDSFMEVAHLPNRFARGTA